MKFVSTILFLFLLLNAVGAQQPFQGSIVYKYNFPQINNSPEITLLFGPNKIKVRSKGKEDFDDTYLLIDLDSGKIFTVNPDTKTFFSRRLTEATAKETSTTKTIAGYQTNSVSIKSSGFSSSSMFGFGPSGSTVLFAASELYYPIPEKYVGSPELMIIQNNHIVLGAEVRTGAFSEDMPDSLKQRFDYSITAIKVEPKTVSIAEFSIPADFTKPNIEDWGRDTVVLDTVYSTVREVVPPPPPPKKKTEKKKTPTKTEAIKQKKAGTKS